MKSLILFLASTFLLLSCNEKTVVFNPMQNIPSSATNETIPFELNCDTLINNNLLFKICNGNDTSAFMLHKSDTLYKFSQGIHNFEITDFNKDGFKDVIFHYVSNNAQDGIYLFDGTVNKFRYVEHSESYPESVKIKNTNYYYCYNRRGCSDLNWDSDLFFIKDYEIHKIGNITGIGCPPNDEKTEIKNGIYIYKIEKDSIETLVQYIPGESGYYKNKWDFIENYWTRNYQNFE